MRYEILGPLRVVADHRDIPITAGRERALLAMLLLRANQVVPVSQLVEVLWAARTPRDVRGQLHGCVSRLRRRLGEAGGQAIVTEPAGYRLRADAHDVDLLEFRELVSTARAATREGRQEAARASYQAALDLWRGPALADIDRDELHSTADSLEEERVAVLEERIELELALGLGGELVSELTELVHRYPYRERLHAARMLALYRAGRQADALAAYQQVRQRLVADLGQEPGPGLRELHRRLLAGDASLRPVAPGSVEVRPAGPQRHCLPRTIADFTGREADLAWLTSAADQADPYAPLVLTIDGMPGAGKTSLAVRAAHLLAPRYPDGQVFLDLHGHSEHRPVALADALDSLLRQMGVPSAHIPADLDERIVRWRAELATRRVLIVLDNAASSAQVAPLLPAGPGCLTLVTSRQRLLDLDGARPRSIGTLTPAEAVALLERVGGERVRDEPDAAAEVAQRCGYLPLALRLAASRLAHRPSWRVRDLADRLADSTPLAELSAGDRTVADAFALSYAHLTPGSQRAFRMLGLHPGEDFDAAATAALAGLDLREAGRRLDELVNANLVEERLAGHYRLHDLLRTYASELGERMDSAADRDRALDQLLDYYLHAALNADGSVEARQTRETSALGPPHRPDLVGEPGARGAGWLLRQRRNLLAAVRHAARTGRDHHVCHLAAATWRFLYHHGHTDDLLATNRAALAAAQRLADPAAAAHAHNRLAAAFYRNGQYRYAAEHLRAVLASEPARLDPARKAITLKNLALVYAEWDSHADAIAHGEQAVALAQECADPIALASSLINLGHVYLLAGRFDEVLRVCRQGLRQARQAGSIRLMTSAIANLGIARARLGRYRQAHRLFTAAVAVRCRFDDRYNESDALNELGVLYREMGDLPKAIAYHRQALALVREVGYLAGECAVQNELGRTLRTAGDLAGALECHQRALADATRIQGRYHQARALEGIAACLRDTEPEQARRHQQQAQAIYRQLALSRHRRVERQPSGRATPALAGRGPAAPAPARS